MEGSSADDKLPLHEDLMQLARLGEVGPVQKLFQDGKYDAQYMDEEGITPLHVCSSSLFNDTLLLIHESGQQSTITMRSAHS